MRRKFLHKKAKAEFHLLGVLFLVAFSLATSGYGFVRPPDPVMDYVPQFIGIYDTYYGSFEADDCRICHGNREAGAIRHQYTGSAFADCPDGCPLSPPNCLTTCHADPNNPQNITYDCRVCHIDAGPLGDLGYPHHRSDLAGSSRCIACHQPDLLVETYSVRTPFYYPTASTPTPFTCENCHWPSGDIPHEPPPDWPKPIEAQGPLVQGALHPSKPYLPNDGTHHEVNGYVIPMCGQCHSNTEDPNWDPLDPLLIRYCENCHSIDSLHSIEEHITIGHGLTAEEKCIACHGGIPPDTTPPSGAEPPTITSTTTSYGPEGTPFGIYGSNFGSSGDILYTPRMGETDQTYRMSSGECNSWTDNIIVFTIPSGHSAGSYNVRVETANGISNMRVFTLTGTKPCIPCPTQTPVINSVEPPVGVPNALVIVHGQDSGDRHTGNRDVLLKDPLSPEPETIDSIYSWTDQEVKFRIPPWIFAPGTLQVKVRTENGESDPVDFLLRRHPTLASINLDTGNLILTGFGFGDSPEYVRPDDYGWKSAVTFNSPDETVYTTPANIISWSETEIQLTLPEITAALYGVAVETIYFYDTDGNGSYTSGLDRIYQTVASDPQLLRPVECTIVPDTPSVSQGGTLGFQATAINNIGEVQVFGFATNVTRPNGKKYPPSGYLKGPIRVRLNPYASTSKHLSQFIPNNTPLGNYTYHGYVGTYAGIYDECTFDFEVIP